jgi:hypothetical protein
MYYQSPFRESEALLLARVQQRVDLPEEIPPELGFL